MVQELHRVWGDNEPDLLKSCTERHFTPIAPLISGMTQLERLVRKCYAYGPASYISSEGAICISSRISTYS